MVKFKVPRVIYPRRLSPVLKDDVNGRTICLLSMKPWAISQSRAIQLYSRGWMDPILDLIEI